MKTILWMPEGNPTVTRLGLVEVEPGVLLTPRDHQGLIADRVQALIDQTEMTLHEVTQTVDDAMAPEGITISLGRDLETAGMYILAGIADRLQWHGAMIQEPTATPLKEKPDLRELWEEMTLGEWLNLASMMPM